MKASSIEERQLLAIDVETTMRCTREGFSSSTPWDTSNEIMLLGIYDGTDSYIYDKETLVPLSLGETKYIIAGHNFKFDLHYIRNTNENLFNQIVALPIWDTSIAHYLLTGQQDHFPSLEEAASKWIPTWGIIRGFEKGSLIKDLIEAGKTTEDADPKELEEYLVADVAITWEVARAQMKVAREMGMIELIYTQCAAMKAIQEMEYNGIHFSLLDASATQAHLNLKMRACAKAIADLVSSSEPFLPDQVKVLTTFKDQWLNANHFWSSFIFGGDYTIKYKEENGVWKSGKKKGQPKYKNAECTLTFTPMPHTPAQLGSTRTKDKHWTVDESVFKKLEASYEHLWAGTVLEYRRIKKLLSTYIESLPTKTWGSVIHPNIHQTVTNTGRTSQSNPNLQNQAGDSEVKRLFIPGDDMSFIEADYKQLEVIAFAFMNRDPLLLHELRDGVDIHDKLATQVFGPSYSKEDRRVVKGVVFGSIYGGGVETIAKQSGLDQGLVWEIQRALYKRYPNIRKYRKAQLEELEVEFKKAKRKDLYGVLTSPTGRWYTIPLDKRVIPGGLRYIPHFTKVCNYPIQGLATGDIVPMMLAYMNARIKKEGLNLLMVNTVHDSILFECLRGKEEEHGLWIKKELEKAPVVFEQMFGVEFDLPLTVEVQWSDTSWAGPWNLIKD